MIDETEDIRKEMIAAINAAPGSREYLESKHGQVWSTSELSDEFEVIGFMAPVVVVRRRSDGQKGSVYFQHTPDMQVTFLKVFDEANPNECFQRNESIVPHQALALANSKLSLQMARTLERQITRGGSQAAARIPWTPYARKVHELAVDHAQAAGAQRQTGFQDCPPRDPRRSP